MVFMMPALLNQDIRFRKFADVIARRASIAAILLSVALNGVNLGNLFLGALQFADVPAGYDDRVTQLGKLFRELEADPTRAAGYENCVA